MCHTALIFSKTRKWLSPKFLREYFEFSRIASLQRFTNGQTTILGKRILFSDSHSFLQAYQEIFTQKLYHFKSGSKAPYILDCGSNIGLSILYFKRLYPQAKIIGFEPDPKLFQMLTSNLEQFGFNDVELHQKAILDSSKPVSFYTQGGSSGQVVMDQESISDRPVIQVDSIQLNPFIASKVDFLKIDIEGAECSVLKSLKDHLHYVERMFVEYHSFADSKQDLDELLSVLKEANFRYHIYPAILKDLPFADVEELEGMDMQLNIYAFKR